MSCNKHKTYVGKHKPLADCLGCWMIFLKENPTKQIDAKTLYRILSQIYSYIKVHHTQIDMLMDPHRFWERYHAT